MEIEQIARRVEELIRPLLASRQVELVEFTCRPAGGRILLKCLVDTARGITVQQLSELNRAIGAVLDEHDAVPTSYLLEVSSPGLDWPLKRWTDFERVIGRRIRVTTLVALDSRFEHIGTLLSANEEAISLALDSGDKLKIPIAQIASAVQDIPFP
jgi:ribosome maturation factor RimP